jgi:hypothetical protein
MVQYLEFHFDNAVSCADTHNVVQNVVFVKKMEEPVRFVCVNVVVRASA